MRKLLLRYFVPATLILTLSNKSFSQFDSTQNIFYLKNLPAEGVLLDKGWKFHAGDNADYARPDYDDSNWEDINPTLDVQKLPQIKQGIVWFRLHLFLDSNLSKKQLVLIIDQSGASQIYLNGSLVNNIGVLNTDPAKIRAYDPFGAPVVLPEKNAGQQILAIRYALQPGVRYTTIFASINYAFKASINTIEAANRNFQQRTFFLQGSGLLLIGIFFILAVLHLSFFLFYRSQKANLYFCLYALFTNAGFVGLNAYGYTHWVEYKFYTFNLAVDITYIGFLFMVTAIYRILEQKRGILYFTVMILGILCIVANALPGYWGWNIGNPLLTNLANLEITRISFIAVKKKKRGAWIMAVGCLCFLVFFGAFLGIGHPGQLDVFTRICFLMGFLSIPVTASVYLGSDFAFTNRLLRRKLIEIDELSQKTIAQEKEKQQILSNQNETLEQQVTERTAELKQSLENLKSTQAQLIQSEKMASLGELTAGIAHEIQNPLNFVNNFSEVNNEIIEELKSQKSKLKNESSEEEEELLNDIFQNNEKIAFHGKRADAIVKGMLQHSRAGTGKKEPTDINALADEYLRLSYHGMRAKDKSFNATCETNFDNSIGKINVVPQDIGRVLLNLFNNALYAIDERRKVEGVGYEPFVSVYTKKVDDTVEIRVKDNGNGIPQKITDKIFQPFFTTKPTGQGTGLGLSLSYDIIKAHGGEIKVETKEGEGAEFVIQLPKNY